jgi:imidazolonepropionase-like amidohydrolase
MFRESQVGKTFFQLFIAAISFITYFSAQTSAQQADRIFVNGKIWTEDDTRPQAQALAVSADKIIAVGSDEEVRAFAAPDTATVDLRGRLVVPGFQDSHLSRAIGK